MAAGGWQANFFYINLCSWKGVETHLSYLRPQKKCPGHCFRMRCAVTAFRQRPTRRRDVPPTAAGHPESGLRGRVRGGGVGEGRPQPPARHTGWASASALTGWTQNPDTPLHWASKCTRPSLFSGLCTGCVPHVFASPPLDSPPLPPRVSLRCYVAAEGRGALKVQEQHP